MLHFVYFNLFIVCTKTNEWSPCFGCNDVGCNVLIEVLLSVSLFTSMVSIVIQWDQIESWFHQCNAKVLVLGLILYRQFDYTAYACAGYAFSNDFNQEANRPQKWRHHPTVTIWGTFAVFRLFSSSEETFTVNKDFGFNQLPKYHNQTLLISCISIHCRWTHLWLFVLH